MLRHLSPDPKQIRDHDAQTELGQMSDDMGADKPGAAGNDDQVVAGQALHAPHDHPFKRASDLFGLYAEIDRYGAAFLTTMPVMTGPVRVFKSVNIFCSSFSRALAT